MIVNSSCRHAFEANGGTGKEYRTALICISAGGQVLCPFLLYAGKNLMSTWCKGGPDGTHFGVTKKVGYRREPSPISLRNVSLFQGWIDTSMYEYWLEQMFIPSTAHLIRPLLLIIDGHASHLSLKIHRPSQSASNHLPYSTQSFHTRSSTLGCCCLQCGEKRLVCNSEKSSKRRKQKREELRIPPTYQETLH